MSPRGWLVSFMWMGLEDEGDKGRDAGHEANETESKHECRPGFFVGATFSGGIYVEARRAHDAKKHREYAGQDDKE